MAEDRRHECLSGNLGEEWRVLSLSAIGTSPNFLQRELPGKDIPLGCCARRRFLAHLLSDFFREQVGVCFSCRLGLLRVDAAKKNRKGQSSNLSSRPGPRLRLRRYLRAFIQAAHGHDARSIAAARVARVLAGKCASAAGYRRMAELPRRPTSRRSLQTRGASRIAVSVCILAHRHTEIGANP